MTMAEQYAEQLNLDVVPAKNKSMAEQYAEQSGLVSEPTEELVAPDLSQVNRTIDKTEDPAYELQVLQGKGENTKAEQERMLELAGSITNGQTPAPTPEGINVQSEGLGVPVVSPEVIVGLVPKAIATGSSIIGGEIVGSILADVGVESVDNLMTDNFKEEYPITSNIIKLGGGILGAYGGSKIEDGVFMNADVTLDLFKSNKNIKIDELAKANVDSISMEDKSMILNAIQEAENAGIKLFGTDVDKGTALAQLQQSMMKNPISAGKMKDTTDAQKMSMLQYIDKIKQGISENFSSVEDVMNFTKENIKLKNQFLDKQVTEAYDAVAELSKRTTPISSVAYTSKLQSIKNKVVSGEYTTDPDAQAKLSSYISKKVRMLKESGNQGTFDDVYGFMRSAIERASEEKSGILKRGYAKMADDLGVMFDEIVESANAKDDIYDTLSQAKSIYKKRVDAFGYRDTGKGTDSFIPKFLDVIESQPDRAIKMIKNKDDWAKLSDHLDENSLGLIRRAKLEDILSSSKVNNEENLAAFNKAFNKENRLVMKEIFGSETYNTLLGVAKAGKYIEDRMTSLQKANILGVEGMRKQLTNTGITGKVEWYLRLIQEKMASNLLSRADQAKLQNMKKGLEQSIKGTGLSLDELLNNTKTIGDEMKYGIKINSEEIFKKPIFEKMKEKVINKPKSPLGYGLKPGGVGGLTNIPKEIPMPKPEEVGLDSLSSFGMGSSYGGTPTSVNTASDAGRSISDLLQPTKKVEPVIEQTPVLDRLGIDASTTPTYPQQGKEVGGLERLKGTLEAKKVDTSGNLGMTSSYGGRATSQGGVNDLMSKSKLDNFMNDIANPSSKVNKEYVSDLAKSLDVDLKLSYAMSESKKKSLSKLRGIIEGLRNINTINGSQKRQIKEALEEYMKAK